jgi:hypothetical protein
MIWNIPFDQLYEHFILLVGGLYLGGAILAFLAGHYRPATVLFCYSLANFAFAGMR